METKKEKRTVAGIPLVLYAIVFAVIVIAYGMGKAPNNFLTGFGFAWSSALCWTSWAAATST